MFHRKLPIVVLMVAVLVAGTASTEVHAAELDPAAADAPAPEPSAAEPRPGGLPLEPRSLEVAWNHSKRMAERNQLFHTANLYEAVRTWSPSTWGENVGFASLAEAHPDDVDEQQRTSGQHLEPAVPAHRDRRREGERLRLGHRDLLRLTPPTTRATGAAAARPSAARDPRPSIASDRGSADSGGARRPGPRGMRPLLRRSDGPLNARGPFR